MKSLKPKCVVLLSGGLDSTTVLAIAKKEFDILALSFDYGQRHKRELACVDKQIKNFNEQFNAWMNIKVTNKVLGCHIK